MKMMTSVLLLITDIKQPSESFHEPNWVRFATLICDSDWFVI